jgi:tRNA threonylcarbamoyl adenosine modification protein YeaZ
MSVTLAIDTSTPTGRIAVVAGETIVFAAEFGSERSHNSEIFEPLGKALTACGDAPGRVVVGTGPGSYTGVRIGIAAGIGIALSKGIDIVGIPSICTPAAARRGDSFTMVGDARRGATYLAKVSKQSLDLAPELHQTEDLQPLEGTVLTHDPAPPIEGAIVTHPSASKLAVLAAMMTDAEFIALAETPPEPIYLRAPFITQPKKPGKAVPTT